MRKIQLTQSYVALVDDEDYSFVNQFKWYAKIAHHKDGRIKNIYAIRNRLKNQKATSLHRLVLGIDDPQIQVDHKDHNGLNCQKHNLRRASNTQNQANARKRKGTASKFKGVSLIQKSWRATIRVNKKPVHLGRFESEEQAAKAYDVEARKIYGEFAHCNFKEE